MQIVAALESLGQASHLLAGGGVVVDVSVAPAVADALHQRGHGVAEVQRHGLARRVGGVGGRGAIGPLDQVRLGGTGQVERRLGQGKRASGRPIRWVICAAADAWTIAWGSASPTSSDARMQSRRAMNIGSAPPSIIRASQ